MNLQTEINPELWRAIAQSYDSGIYKSAILEAIHYLSNTLREKANVDGDGASLVGQALGGENPRLRINKFQTETEKTEQKGLEQLLRGIYLGIRNPRSHEGGEDDQDTANSIILFINHITGVINQSKESFSLPTWKKRIFDPDFVASPRYAKLLALEVPPKKRVDALIEVYREKALGDASKLQYIFSSLIDMMDDQHLGNFLEIVSDELKFTQHDDCVRTVLQILPKDLWPQIDEAARLRVENKLIDSIKSGKYCSNSGKTKSGWLGTWARDFIRLFSLKSQLYDVFLEKLRGPEEGRDYIVKYFLNSMPYSWNESSNGRLNTFFMEEYINEIVRNISNSSESFLRDELLDGIGSLPSDWQNLILKGVKDAKDLDDDYYEKLVAIIEENSF